MTNFREVRRQLWAHVFFVVSAIGVILHFAVDFVVVFPVARWVRLVQPAVSQLKVSWLSTV